MLSRDPSFQVEGAECFRELPSLLVALPKSTEDVAVIGGASVYEALLPYCERVCLTRTPAVLPADRFFPDLDRLPDWTEDARSEVLEENGTRFQYIDYVNHPPSCSPPDCNLAEGVARFCRTVGKHGTIF